MKYEIPTYIVSLINGFMFVINHLGARYQKLQTGLMSRYATVTHVLFNKHNYVRSTSINIVDRILV